ncbi:MAG TPA: hypothetical protein VF618_08170 [Thermoanaerobaculia bacterium]
MARHFRRVRGVYSTMTVRGVFTCLAFLAMAVVPVGIGVWAWRVPAHDAGTPWVAWGLVGVAFCVAGVNAWLSWGRGVLYRRRHGSLEGYRFVSGFPLVGAGVAVLAVILAFGHDGVAAIALLSMVVAPGSPLWFLPVVWRQQLWRP